MAKNQEEVFEEENDEYGDDGNEVEIHDNSVGDLDKYYT
jgi:hypothetical protein